MVPDLMQLTSLGGLVVGRATPRKEAVRDSYIFLFKLKLYTHESFHLKYLNLFLTF